MRNIAINGFGRIGRLVFRGLLEHDDINVVAINDITDVKTLAHLLKYDSCHGVLKYDVTHTENEIIVNGHEVKIFAKKDPAELPWKDLGVEIVIESTGIFLDRAGAQKHIDAGAKKSADLGPAQRRGGRDHRAGRQRQHPDPRTQDRFQRLLHHQLPGPHRQGAS